ncbi:MAG: GMP reductase [Hyphomicrobiales bacterium]|nr:MAG: GMP reductase [Hyphomicrobiales bacterium]
MRIEENTKYDFDDVLIKPKRSTLTSRKDVVLHRTFKFKHSKAQIDVVPIIAANMDSVGNYGTYKVLSKYHMLTCFSKFKPLQGISSNPEDYFYGIPSFGINDSITLGPAWAICLDVANGYTEKFIDKVKDTRAEFPKITIIAGNVCTHEMTQALILAGADIVKVGIGPGSNCLTREKTGVGYPQLSAIIECAEAAHALDAHIIGDGGCNTPGDVAKAFAAGADFVMLGGMLGGHEENSDFDDENNAIVYGMSSTLAMKNNYGKVSEYKTSEGRITKVKNKGSLNNTVQDILGGLRSTCTYAGASELKHLSKCTSFIKVNNILNRTYERETIGE